MYQAVFFDLDGTLADSAPGIFGSMRYALAQFGITPSDRELHPFLGPPLQQMFAHFLPAEQVARGVELYRAHYGAGGLFDARIYDGVPQMLARLRGAGAAVCLATAKPRTTARRVLDHFELTQWFDLVGGTTEESGVATKTEVIRKNIRDGGFDPQRCLMVGDRRDDLDGAAAAGIDGLGVLYGYGSREELLAHPHRALAQTPAAVADFALGAAAAR